MRITFLGAAGEVTGSQHLIETDNLRLLLDCGMFQGPREAAYRKNETFHCDPENLDGVILSHAHIDHCGLLPRLVKHGFDGPIFCTAATAGITPIMLRDSAFIQAEDAKYLSRKLKPGHPPLDPLYDKADVEQTRKQLDPLDFDEWHELSNDLSLRFSRAGHILGSAIIQLRIKDGRDTRGLVFTGDLGRRGLPLICDPEPVDDCEILISESTYGNRLHPPAANLKDNLLEILKEAVTVEGRVIIPAFSLGRTQQIVFYLNELFEEGLLPPIPIFVDSPLATKLTNVYRDHQETLDEEVRDRLETDADPFGFDRLVYVADARESRELNHRKGAFVVIAASGMCEGGRVRHHLLHAVERPENTVVIIGFQAYGTLGRQLVEQAPKVKIFDKLLTRRAKVITLNGFSGHADVEDFRWWFRETSARGGIGQTFLVHGEPAAAQALASAIDNECNEPPIIPERRQTFEV